MAPKLKRVAAEEPSLTPDQARLVELGLPMVMQCAAEIGRRYRGCVEKEELLAPGTFALREAAITYQEDKHPSFPLYARHHIRGRMIDAVRAEHFSLRARVERTMDRSYEVLAAHQKLGVELFDGDEGELLDEARRGAEEVLAAAVFAGMATEPGASPEDALIDRITLHEAAHKLFPHEREVVRLVCEERMTVDEVAEALHIAPRTAQRRYSAALRKLHAFIGDRGIKGG